MDKEAIKDAVSQASDAASIEKLLAQAEQALTDKQRAELAKQEWRKEQRERCKSIIEQEDLFYISDRDKIYRRSKDTFYKLTAIFTEFNITKQIVKEDFKTILLDTDRMKAKVVSTFSNNVASDELNLMTTANWVNPIEGDVHPNFDILMTSLSSGRDDVREHIEQCVYWKYMNPGDFSIPAIAIYGEQETGKNTMVDRVLSTLFTRKQVVSTGHNRVFGDFNGIIAGKAVVMVDESSHTKADEERMKQYVANPQININEKYMVPIEVDNHIWWWFATNNLGGPVKLAGKGDRRYSVIECEGGINKWSKHLGFDKKYFLDNFSVFSNRDEVGKWLMSLIEKHHALSRVPQAYHGEDYDEALDSQPDAVFDNWIEEYFRFQCRTKDRVTTKEMHEYYKTDWQENNPHDKIWGIDYFSKRANASVKKRNLDWEKGQWSAGHERPRGFIKTVTPA